MKHVVVAGLAALTLTACGGSGSTLSPADNITIDCQAAAQSIANYSVSFRDMVTALEANEPSIAGPAAAEFGLSARAIVDQLPGLPPDAQGFVAVSQRFADRVRDVISGNGDLPPLAVEAETQFADPAFVDSVDVVEGFFSANCPTTIIPTPSPTPSEP
ncbi:MAG: hypothetical protein ACO3JT_04170 [Candidatus Nanopelagicales bacterium]|jgi:hypothetical protein